MTSGPPRWGLLHGLPPGGRLGDFAGEAHYSEAQTDAPGDREAIQIDAEIGLVRNVVLRLGRHKEAAESHRRPQKHIRGDDHVVVIAPAIVAVDVQVESADPDAGIRSRKRIGRASLALTKNGMPMASKSSPPASSSL